jgi:maltooligosyltrehalose trehalohydrolase
MTGDRPLLGALADEGGVSFGAYVTPSRACAVRIRDADGAARGLYPMRAIGGGYFETRVEGAGPGTLYELVIDGRKLPDPHARFLPMGVHGPARVEAARYVPKNRPVATRLAEQIIYEIHVGTFTPEGTYDAARRRLGYLASLGVRTIELMPLAAFAGARGWGYDGVAHYAPFAPYGEPDDLRRFVDEAHGYGLSVVLDVVYNHFGPSGNYLSAFSDEYFVQAETTWGQAPDFARAPMRRYVIDNATYWVREFGFDGLRLDAIHAIDDRSEVHVLREVTAAVHQLGKRVLFAEDERNDPDVVTSLGFDALWADDFHHQLRVTLTGENEGYYGAYAPGARGVADAINRGWIYEGQIFPATGNPRGKPARELLAESLVYCIQNHDQIGNRPFGDRLSASVSTDAYCAASMLLLFLPMTPLLFMGQEWAASTPFLYFTDHEPELGDAIAEGRRRELRSFSAFADPASALPDPQAAQTFESSKLRWDERSEEAHRAVLELYRELLYLRRTDPVLQDPARERLQAEARGDVLVVRRALGADVRVLCVNFGATSVPLRRLEIGPRLLPVLTSCGELEGDVLPAKSAVLLAARVGAGAGLESRG